MVLHVTQAKPDQQRQCHSHVCGHIRGRRTSYRCGDAPESNAGGSVSRCTHSRGQPLLVLAGPAVLPFKVQASAVFRNLNPRFCWFHPRVAAMPGHGIAGRAAVVMTIQKHLGVSDHYSGLYFLRTNDLGETWTAPTEIPELTSQPAEDNETIAVCDVTPGWLTHSRKLLAIGVKLRYSPKGEQLVDRPRSHECAYATYDPVSDKWTAWKMLAMPETEGKFFLVAPVVCSGWSSQTVRC